MNMDGVFVPRFLYAWVRIEEAVWVCEIPYMDRLFATGTL